MTMADLNTTTSTTGSIPTAANTHGTKRPGARAKARPSDPQRARRAHKEAIARNRLQKELRSDRNTKSLRFCSKTSISRIARSRGQIARTGFTRGRTAGATTPVSGGRTLPAKTIAASARRRSTTASRRSKRKKAPCLDAKRQRIAPSEPDTAGSKPPGSKPRGSKPCGSKWF